MQNRNPQYHNILQKALEIAEPEEIFFAEFIANKIFEALKNKKISHVLDFGCGKGLITALLKNHLPQTNIHGIDQSQQNIALAQKTFSQIDFAISNIKLPFKDNSFDVIYISLVLHHLTPAEQKNYIQELMRILKPNGLCIIIEFNPLNLSIRKKFKNDPEEKDAQMLWSRQIKKLLQPYGKLKKQYYLFFQRCFSSLRFLEPYLWFMPFATLYQYTLIKK